MNDYVIDGRGPRGSARNGNRTEVHARRTKTRLGAAVVLETAGEPGARRWWSLPQIARMIFAFMNSNALGCKSKATEQPIICCLLKLSKKCAQRHGDASGCV